MSVALKNLVNALYCKDASKKVRAAKAVLAKQGKYIAAFAPFGYQKSEDDKHMLVPDPVTAPVVQQIFELAIKGMKYTEIANYLNNNGYDSIFEYYQKIGVKRCYDKDIGEHMSIDEMKESVKADKNIRELTITYRPANPDQGIIDKVKEASDKERLKESNATERSKD